MRERYTCAHLADDLSVVIFMLLALYILAWLVVGIFVLLGHGPAFLKVKS